MSNSVGTPLLNGTTSTGAWTDWPGGDGRFNASCANWNGATVRLEEISQDGGTGIPVDNGTTDVTFTANHVGGFTLPKTQIRAGIIGSPLAGVYSRADAMPVVAVQGVLVK